MADFPNRQASEMYNTSLEFFGTAGSFFQQIPEDIDPAVWFTTQRKAKLQVAVTNMALAIELILKAMLILTNGSAKPRTHDLLKLFNALPPELQESIEREYKERGGESTSAEARSLEFRFYPVGTSLSAATLIDLRSKLVQKYDLRSVLENERDAFVIWRYMTEQAKPGQTMMVRVEYTRLAVIMNSIQRHFRIHNP
jgi:hypothetical protein